MVSSGTIGGSGSLSRPSLCWSNTSLLIYMALATVILHAVVGNSYGLHCDELATLEHARHLPWGYPAYPPVTPFFSRLSLILFGTSLARFRFFASLADASTVVLGGLMARELGGKRGAQLAAGPAAMPICIGGAALMQYVSFDYAAWVFTAYFIVLLLRSGNPRWWVAAGAAIGLGMLSKRGKASEPFFFRNDAVAPKKKAFCERGCQVKNTTPLTGAFLFFLASSPF